MDDLKDPDEFVFWLQCLEVVLPPGFDVQNDAHYKMCHGQEQRMGGHAVWYSPAFCLSVVKCTNMNKIKSLHRS